jgi:uncharacterized membrane protein
MGVVESGTGRARRDAEGLGDLARGIPQEVVEDEDRPLVGRQPAEPTFELVPIGDGKQIVGCGRSVDRQHSQVHRPAALARCLADAHVDEQPAQPRIESFRIAEPTEVTPGDHQRILQGILGPIDVAEDLKRDREQPVRAWADQVHEGRFVPTSRCCYEVVIHSLTPAARRSGACWEQWSSRGVERSDLLGGEVWIRTAITPDGAPRFAQADILHDGGLHTEEPMAELYPWFVVAHLVGLVLFAVSHGASAFMAFRVRGERDPVVVDSLLKMGQMSVGPMYFGLALLAIGGFGAAAAGNLWGQWWILASIVVFVVLLVVMGAVASPYYRGLRKALEVRTPDGRPAIEPAELSRRLDSRRPEVLALVGTVGLVLLVWLMVIKPL